MGGDIGRELMQLFLCRSPSPDCGGDRADRPRHTFAKSRLAEIKKDILNIFGEEGNGHPPEI